MPIDESFFTEIANNQQIDTFFLPSQYPRLTNAKIKNIVDKLKPYTHRIVN